MAMGSSELEQNLLSSEVQQDQSSPRESTPPPVNEEKDTHLSFLISNDEAGSIIGKGGSTINDIQSQSRTRIQLSRNYEYFPGTTDRIVTVSGIVDNILKAIDLIFSKLLEFYVEDGGETDPDSIIRLVVPSRCCGAIIGKRGAIIRSLIEDSQAYINISPQDICSGLQDRLVSIIGTLGDQMRAIELILLKLIKDRFYEQPVNAPFPYGASPYSAMNHVPSGAGMKYQNRLPNKDRSTSVTIGIADEYIGLIVGSGGRTIMEIRERSGARITISDRGDFMPGTSNRKVTITGCQRAISVAETMITERVASVTER